MVKVHQLIPTQANFNWWNKKSYQPWTGGLVICFTAAHTWTMPYPTLPMFSYTLAMWYHTQAMPYHTLAMPGHTHIMPYHTKTMSYHTHAMSYHIRAMVKCSQNMSYKHMTHHILPVPCNISPKPLWKHTQAMQYHTQDIQHHSYIISHLLSEEQFIEFLHNDAWASQPSTSWQRNTFPLTVNLAQTGGALNIVLSNAFHMPSSCRHWEIGGPDVDRPAGQGSRALCWWFRWRSKWLKLQRGSPLCLGWTPASLLCW